MDEAARSAALERLNPFVGEWTLQAKFPFADTTGIVGRTAFEWVLGEQFLVQRSEVPHPDAPDGMSIIGLDPRGGGYSQHYFDSRGVVRVYSMDLSDGVWTLVRKTPDFLPLEFSQRFAGTFSDDGDTIEGRWETSPDGSSWELDFDLTYRRVPGAASAA